MCGRFTLRTPTNELVEQFLLPSAEQLPLRFNIAPTQEVAAVRADAEGNRCLAKLRWGLVPSWAKDRAIGSRLINARSESVAEKPSFRAAFRRRRCLVLADGYYEWQKVGSRKQPYYIRLRNERPFAFAGLWETWQEQLESCTIITTDANALTRGIHDRMPAILLDSQYTRWLDPQCGDAAELLPLLRPYASDLMVADPVSTYVNSPRNDGPQCVVLQRPGELG